MISKKVIGVSLVSILMISLVVAGVLYILYEKPVSINVKSPVVVDDYWLNLDMGNLSLFAGDRWTHELTLTNLDPNKHRYVNVYFDGNASTISYNSSILFYDLAGSSSETQNFTISILPNSTIGRLDGRIIFEMVDGL